MFYEDVIYCQRYQVFCNEKVALNNVQALFKKKVITWINKNGANFKKKDTRILVWLLNYDNHMFSYTK